jgi:ABC-2 type transport system ATP-binding protein
MKLHGNEILRGASLSVEPGTIVCLAGANGAGKTTLLRVAAGIFTPQSGQVHAGGLHPKRDRAQFARRIGFVTAGNDGVYARLKVRQNLQFWAAIAYLPKERRREAIDAVIEMYGLTELADRRSDRLSLGQRQRIRMALGTVHDPDVLLLDEPHTSLDDEGLDVLGRAMTTRAERGGAVV